MKGKGVGDTATIGGFLRHIRGCNNARLPGERRPFRFGETPVGWVKPDLAAALAGFPAVTADATAVTLNDPAALASITATLADRGLCARRGELFDVRARPDGPVLAQIDRGAVPLFGVCAVGAHLNGLVRRPDGLHVWIARRAANKTLDPGKLDHITAGGVPAGLTPRETMIKEAGEEAAIPAPLASQARHVGTLSYAMERSEGLRRDIVHCYDLDLPGGFVPRPVDGEVAAFELWPVADAVAAVRDSDAFKFNVNLVLIDLFLRHGFLDSAVLRAALESGAA